jgi:hypothetical protein
LWSNPEEYGPQLPPAGVSSRNARLLRTLHGGWLEGTNVSKSSSQHVVVSTITGQGDPGYWLTSREFERQNEGGKT